MNQLTEFEKDLEIDKFSLDAECLDQPRKFMKWSADYADSLAERDRADQKLEVTKAQVEQEVRKNPELYGLDKVTEASIKAAVTISREVDVAFEEWVEAKHRVGIMMAAREALEQRKNMLENLVKLFLSGYWSDPKVSDGVKREMNKDVDAEITKGMTKSTGMLKRKK
jgi:hypothetical protein